MTAVVAANGPTWFWYLARGSGLVVLILLTVSVVIGVVTSVRWSNDRWPRFAIQLVHRNVSLLVVVFIALHISTVVVDGFAPIGWKDAVVPFASGYRVIWVGLGAVAFDVVVALTITSLLRSRIGHRTWRTVHWLAYLCWPLVVVHGLASGTDTKLDVVVVTNVICVVSVVLAVWWRIAAGWPEQLGPRVASLAATAVGPLVLVVWVATGPLAAGWAREAGTPASLLPKARAVSSASAAPRTPATSSPQGISDALPAAPFAADFSGTSDESRPDATGRVTSRIRATLGHGASGELGVELTGPVDERGLLIETSRVTLGPTTRPTLYVGEVTDVVGDQLFASLSSKDAPPLTLTIRIQVDARAGRATGRLEAAASAESPAASSPNGGER